MNRLPFVIFCLLSALIVCAACTFNPSQMVQSGLTPGESLVQTPSSPLSLRFEPNFVQTGLEQLYSYRVNLIVEFEGTRAGRLAQGRVESLTAVTRQPDALHQYLKVQTTITDSTIITGASEFFRLDDKVFVKRGDQGEWFSYTEATALPHQVGFLALDHLMALPAKLTQPGQAEMLDGREVERYSFTAGDLADPNLIFEQAQGELWLAGSGSYLAQYTLTATLRVVIPDPKAHLLDQGQLHLRYTLADINEAFQISPPDNVLTRSNPFSRLPRLPDAELISIFPSFIEYASTISLVEAIQFYRDRLTRSGWAEDSALVFKEKARLAFSKKDQTITVLINPGDQPGKIRILLDISAHP
jgi:hypothetical protein